MNVLYVGNNKEFIEHLLKVKEFNVIVRQNGLEVLRDLKINSNYDCICAQYDLPFNNGLYILKKIKSNKKLKHISCILLQEKFEADVLNESFNTGIEDYYIYQLHSYQQIKDRILSFPTQIIETTKHTDHAANAKIKLPLSKRLFDITAASLLLLVLSPILVITMIAIRIESKGKVYYSAKRVGRKTFDFYKFRSMRVGADKMLKELAKSNNQYGTSETNKKEFSCGSCSKCNKLMNGETCSSIIYDGEKEICERLFLENKKQELKENARFIKIVDDPRITKIGKFIRNTSIDELPQLINVIKGDMSLVGNRPLPVYEAETLTKDQMSKRFLAPAGITGLWQVELRGKGGDMSEEERIELDNKYADYFTNNNYSFWFDIKILLRTVPALFQQSTV